jgi:hypothetical protein
MKESKRGFLKKSIDEMLADKNFQQEVMDVIVLFEKELPIHSVKDLTIGFVIGVLYSFSASILGIKEGIKPKAETKEAEEETLAMIKRRLPEIMESFEDQLNK